jgi:hypothetical protein
LWQDVGAALFPYQRNSTVNIDYGCLNPATIAYNDNIIVWLAGNEKSGPMIAYSTGGDIKKISTDGIDFKFSELTNPVNSFGFLFRQDGHLLYQITFPDDELTYVYDFNTQMFFTFTDEKMNAHIAQKVAFFNDNYYFVSSTDGNLYILGTNYTDYNGLEIPRIRICKNIRLPDASRFVVNNLTFTLEQGDQENFIINQYLLTESLEIIMTENDEPILIDQDADSAFPYPVPQTVYLTISRDGGESFSNSYSQNLNPRGLRQNRLIYWRLGSANDFVPQFRFIGLGRFVATDGIVSIYQ